MTSKENNLESFVLYLHRSLQFLKLRQRKSFSSWWALMEGTCQLLQYRL